MNAKRCEEEESWYFHQKREGKMFEKSRIQFNARHEDNINRGRLLMTLLITRTRVRWRNIILEFILRHIHRRTKQYAFIIWKYF